MLFFLVSELNIFIEYFEVWLGWAKLRIMFQLFWLWFYL